MESLFSYGIDISGKGIRIIKESEVKRVIGWVIFGFGILYLFIAPTVARIQMDAGNAVFGGMSLQIGIGIAIIGIGWVVAHPKKSPG